MSDEKGYSEILMYSVPLRAQMLVSDERALDVSDNGNIRACTGASCNIRKLWYEPVKDDLANSDTGDYTTSDSAETGDKTDVILWSILFAAMLSIIIVFRKKNFNIPVI